MYKFVPFGAHRQAVERPDDYAVYVFVMSRVKVRREEVLERFGSAATGCIERLVHLGVVDNECDVGRGWFVSVPLKDVNGEHD